jgi:uncharacterized membrane protein
MDHTFPTIGTLLKRSWHSVTQNWLVFYAAYIIMMAVGLAFGSVTNAMEETALLLLFAVPVTIGLNLLFSIGLTRIALSCAAGHAELKELVSEYRYIPVFLVASILFGILTMIGFILFIIPGIILSLMFGQYVYAILDKQKGIVGSLQYSAAITKGYRWRVFLIGIVSVLIVIVSIIPLGLGLLITIPLMSFLQGHVYITLRDIYEAKQSGRAEQVSGTGTAQEPSTETTPSAPQPFEPLQ